MQHGLREHDDQDLPGGMGEAVLALIGILLDAVHIKKGKIHREGVIPLQLMIRTIGRSWKRKANFALKDTEREV